MKKLTCVVLTIIVILSSCSYALANDNSENNIQQIDNNSNQSVEINDMKKNIDDNNNINGEISPMYMGDAYRVIPTIGVNVRQGPGIEYNKIGVFAYNTIVYEIDFAQQDTNGEWWQLVSNSNGSIEGWVKSEYLEIISN